MAVTSTAQPASWRPLAAVEWVTSNYLVRRLVKALFTVWVVSTITFFVVRAMPGNAVDILVQDLTLQGISPDDARNQAASLMNINLDAPAYEQYLEYLGNVARGNLGNSYRSRGLRVSDMIAAVLPWTLFSVGLSLVIAFTFGIVLGTIIAYKRDTWIDHVISNIAATLDAVSQYLIGLLAILLIGVIWKLVPVSQMRGAFSPGMEAGFTPEFFLDVFNHVKVLLLVYVLSSVGGWTLLMKSNTVSTLGEDYVSVAKARGLTEYRILTAYVGRNATLPLFTRLAIQIGFAVGGALLLEGLFAYRGLGYLLNQAISGRDYPVIQGIILVITIAVVFANLIADYLYGWLDPRIRIAGRSE